MNALNVDLTQQEDPGLSPEQTITSWIRSITMLTEMSLLSIISRPNLFFVCVFFCNVDSFLSYTTNVN